MKNANTFILARLLLCSKVLRHAFAPTHVGGAWGLSRTCCRRRVYDQVGYRMPGVAAHLRHAAGLARTDRPGNLLADRGGHAAAEPEELNIGRGRRRPPPSPTLRTEHANEDLYFRRFRWRTLSRSQYGLLHLAHAAGRPFLLGSHSCRHRPHLHPINFTIPKGFLVTSVLPTSPRDYTTGIYLLQRQSPKRSVYQRYTPEVGGAVKNDRREKGIFIAATMKIRPTRDGWFVPSMSGEPDYLVRKTSTGLKCGCEDFQLRSQPCKHIWALSFYRRREEDELAEVAMAAPRPPPRKTYRQPSFANYNAYQVAEKRMFGPLLAELVSPYSWKPTSIAGRPRLPLNDCLFTGIAKVASKDSARRAIPGIEIAQQQGLIARTPCYNSVILFLEDESITPLLEELVTESCKPLRTIDTGLAADSTGFSSQLYMPYFRQKRARLVDTAQFVKLHAITGVRTHCVAAARVTDSHVADIKMFETLIQAAAKCFAIADIYADKAYLSEEALEYIHKLGARAWIAFKKNSQPHATPGVWNDNLAYSKEHKSEWLGNYNQRSNVEAVFSAIKRRFNPYVLGRTLIAQRNEVLMKVISYNIGCVVQAAYELGINPTYDRPLPKNPDFCLKTPSSWRLI